MAGVTPVAEPDGTISFQSAQAVNQEQESGFGYREVMTLDELCLIIRSDSGLRFDEQTLTHFHFYGPDICLSALAQGRRNYALDVPTVHLSDGKSNIAAHYPEFRKQAKQFYTKWYREFPLIATSTTCFCLGIIDYVLARQNRLAPAQETMPEIQRYFEQNRPFAEVVWESVLQTRLDLVARQLAFRRTGKQISTVAEPGKIA
jgi:hypothetical protein